MVLFVVQFYEPKSAEYVTDIEERLKGGLNSYVDLSRSFVSVKTQSREEFVIFDTKPQLPPVYWVFAILSIGGAVFGLPWWYHVVMALCFVSTLLFWTSYPYLLGLKLGFRKKYGHYPSLRIVPKDDVIRQYAGWTSGGR
jgi:hypothetical protein